MKKLRVLVFAFCAYTCAYAQAPQSINYQAIAWNSNNTPRANATINVTLIIHNQSPTALPAELMENYQVKTNGQGLFTLEIGSQKPADFQKINWGGGAKFLEVQIDGVIAGNSKMLSVPYALYAENTNLKAGSGITISDHTISSTGTTYSAGSGIAISSNNSISTDLKQGTGISIKGNTITNTGDVDTTNEIQKLSINGNVLSLDKKGGSVTLPAPTASATYSAGSGIAISSNNVISTDLKAGSTGISIVGNTITNTGDIDSKNEIQTLSYSTDGQGTLGISNGNSIPHPTLDNIENYCFAPRKGFMTIDDNSDYKEELTLKDGAWHKVDRLGTITVPTTGLYLVYFTAFVYNVTVGEEVAVRVSSSTLKKTNTLFCVTYGNERGQNSSTWVMSLDKGEILQMEYNLSTRDVPASKTVGILNQHAFGIVRIR